MLDRVDEFVDYLMQHKKQQLIKLIGSEFNLKEPNAFADNFDLICDYVNDIIENKAKKTSHTISHEGGDTSVYKNGVWKTVLYEIYGWYFWKEPEGETYGFFFNLEDALNYSDEL